MKRWRAAQLRRRDQRGVLSVELVLLTPVLMGAILTIIGAFRYVEARDQVSSVANIAGRAASLSDNQGDAVAEGQRAARQALGERGESCAVLRVDVAAGGFKPGGNIRVTVTCVADLSDVVGFGLPGSRTFTSTAVVPIESHRVL